jgi:Anti-sigma-K factor rskA, C-terminal
VNEDEFAELLESGAHPQGRASGHAARPGEEIRALLADESVWVEPDPGGAEALLAAIRRESASPSEAPETGADSSAEAERARAGVPSRYAANGRGAHRGPSPSRPAAAGAGPGVRRAGVGRHGRPAGGRGGAAGPVVALRGRSPVLAVAAALVVIAGLVGALLLGGGDHHGGQEFALAGTDLSPAASAWATIDHQSAGVAIKLDVRGLPPAEDGMYYEAWVEGADGKVTVGTFHMRGGDGWIYLWSGVEPAEYPMLRVTLEDEGGDQESSGRVVLSGRIVT